MQISISDDAGKVPWILHFRPKKNNATIRNFTFALKKTIAIYNIMLYSLILDLSGLTTELLEPLGREAVGMQALYSH